MSKIRDIADSADVINFLDGVTSDVQTQISTVQGQVNTILLTGGSLTETVSLAGVTNIPLYTSSLYSGAKLIINIADSVTGDTQITEALLLTVDGGTPKITTYATMHTSLEPLASFDASNILTDTSLELNMISSNSTSVKIAYTLLNA